MNSIVTNEQIEKIEKALDIKLYDWQRELLQANDKSNRRLPDGRGNGKTLLYCVDLAMSVGDPIRISELYKYSDGYGRYGPQYDNGFFKHMFMDIWQDLKDIGLPVREIKGINK